jgi:hypothetical protein
LRGDDKNDMIAGKNAGIKTVAVTYGYGTVAQDWGYDYLIDYPQEIQRLILFLSLKSQKSQKSIGEKPIKKPNNSSCIKSTSVFLVDNQ